MIRKYLLGFGSVILFIKILVGGAAEACVGPLFFPAKAAMPAGVSQTAESTESGSAASQTPLMLAIIDTDKSAFRSRLDGADVNAVDDAGWTALMYAARFGEVSFVKALLKKNAAVNVQSKTGLTPLIIAARMLIFNDKTNAEMAKLLIEHGADVNAKGKDGITALMSAAMRGRLKLVKLLVEKGAKLNEEDAGHATALTYALGRQQKETADYLKSAGATGLEPTMPIKPAGAALVDQRPVSLNAPMPHYTESARSNRVEGVVIARVLVGPDGTVKQVRVIKGLPDGLTHEAIRAAYDLRFKPAMKAGKPVPFWQSIQIDFRLR